MNSEKINSIRDTLKNIKPKDVVYPGILFVYIVLVAVVFFFATQFISKSINNVFYSTDAGDTEALNLEPYKLVAKKLGIVVSAPKDNEPPNQVIVNDAPTIATSTPSLDKKAITIAVKNSTTKAGIASTLAKAIEGAGFKKPQTGNEATFYATTTVIMNEGKKEYADILLEVVRKSYPEAISTTTADTGSNDAIVVIGVK